ncbi:hypothetical protein IC620_16120 [Hazenella sp. IB182357]|uniref:Uncharacterized protein n=1 Tax=Polycladospora coralii TaxID=2771432 RepID=A0A926N8A2_9BACL|nr:hypothetical protein [Polycladospora coralii]MBD1373871.1 hypothetical protein [Polycladospora coralii]
MKRIPSETELRRFEQLNRNIMINSNYPLDEIDNALDEAILDQFGYTMDEIMDKWEAQA